MLDVLLFLAVCDHALRQVTRCRVCTEVGTKSPGHQDKFYMEGCPDNALRNGSELHLAERMGLQPPITPEYGL